MFNNYDEAKNNAIDLFTVSISNAEDFFIFAKSQSRKFASFESFGSYNVEWKK